jgi:hypothetical protein
MSSSSSSSQFCPLWVVFCVYPRRLIFECRCFGTIFKGWIWSVEMTGNRDQCLYRSPFEDGTDRWFRNVGIQKSDAGDTPKRLLTIIKTRRKFEIKNSIRISVNSVLQKAVLVHALTQLFPLFSFYQQYSCPPRLSRTLLTFHLLLTNSCTIYTFTFTLKHHKNAKMFHKSVNI